MEEFKDYFDNENIRHFEKNGTTFFVVKDICKFLDLSNVSSYLKNLPEDWKLSEPIKTSSNQPMLTVNEYGLYKIILHSNKPIADKFKDWICQTVLPSIRKSEDVYKQKIDEQKKQIEEKDNLLKEQGEKLEQQEKLIEKQKALLYEKETLIKKLQRETQVVEGKNVVYLATTDDLEKDGVYTVGKAIDLKNRLQTYNNNKLHNFKIVKYISCKCMKLMDAIEQVILVTFNKYKIVSKRDVFQLPSGTDVSFFTKHYDYYESQCKDIDENIELEDRSEEEKKEVVEEKKEILKDVKSEFNKEYRKEHHDEILDRERQFRENNNEFIKERNLEYRLNNPEKEKERKEKYASLHQEEKSIYMKKYREENSEHISETKKIYNMEHKEENEKKCRCKCGSIVSKQNFNSHLDTEIHKLFLETGKTVNEQRKEESVVCDCGMTISKRGVKRHCKSKIHQEFVKNGVKIIC